MGLKLEDLVLYAVTDTSWLRGQTLVQQVEAALPSSTPDKPVSAVRRNISLHGRYHKKKQALTPSSGQPMPVFFHSSAACRST